MKLVYLGTSGAMPTIDRGLSCTVLALDKEYIMVDCGDGSCRQFLKSNLKWNKPMTILITHMHSDHTMGLLGLLQSMDLMGRTEPIKIYGVRGLKKFIESVSRSANLKTAFSVDIMEIQAGYIIMGDSFIVHTCETNHQVEGLAYRVHLPMKDGKLDIEKCLALGVPNNSPLLGKLKSGDDVTLVDGSVVKSADVVGQPTAGVSIGFSGDTRPTPRLMSFFHDVDYLTYETTFRGDEQELAMASKHSTAEEAGILAERAGVRTLLANHFSARHPDTNGIRSDIAKHFHGKVIITFDFLEVEINA